MNVGDALRRCFLRKVQPDVFAYSHSCSIIEYDFWEQNSGSFQQRMAVLNLAAVMRLFADFEGRIADA